jgi:hypothetical protein
MEIVDAFEKCNLGTVNIVLKFWSDYHQGTPTYFFDESFDVRSESDLIDRIDNYTKNFSTSDLTHRYCSVENNSYHYLAMDNHKRKLHFIITTHNQDILIFFKTLEKLFYERQKIDYDNVEKERDDLKCREYIKFLQDRGYQVNNI